jgi:hypothetical protein
MKCISEQQQKTDERSLAKVLVCLNCALIILLFTVSYIQR